MTCGSGRGVLSPHNQRPGFTRRGQIWHPRGWGHLQVLSLAGLGAPRPAHGGRGGKKAALLEGQQGGGKPGGQCPVGGVGEVRAQGLTWALMLSTERWWVTTRELFASHTSLHLPRGRAHLCFPITREKKLGREDLEAKE